MQRRKKQLLGAFGLASVVAMTAIAITLPVPDAAAADTASTTVKVTVVDSGTDPGPGPGPGPSGPTDPTDPTDPDPDPTLISSVRIDKPTGDATILNNEVDLEVAYKNISTISYTLTCSNSSGTKTFNGGGSVTNSNTEQIYTDTIDVSALGGIDYNCRLKVSSEAGVIEDNVNLEYRSVALDVNDTTEVNKQGEPYATVYSREDVEYVKLMIFDMDNKAMMVKDGALQYITITKAMFEEASMSMARMASTVLKYGLYLPMVEYGMPYGRYRLVAEAYNAADEIVSINEKIFIYNALNPGVMPTDPTPDVPGTGAFFRNLNFSRADYVFSGLAVFTVLACIAVRLIIRRRKAEQ